MRSKWKGPYIEANVLKKLINKSDKIDTPKIYSRGSTILLSFIGKKVAVYNGKQWVSFIITEEMLDHKFGDFVPTRKRHIFGRLTKTKK